MLLRLLSVIALASLPFLAGCHSLPYCAVSIYNCENRVEGYGDISGLDDRTQGRLEARSDFRRFRRFVQSPKQRGATLYDYWLFYVQTILTPVIYPLTGKTATLPEDPGPPMSPRMRARILLWLSGRVIGDIPDRRADTFVNFERSKVRLTEHEAEERIRRKHGLKTKFLTRARDYPAALLDFALFPVVAINLVYIPVTGESLLGSIHKEPVHGRIVHSADTIMDHFDPEDFQTVMADAGYAIVDLDLPDDEITELTKEGYLPLAPEAGRRTAPTKPVRVVPAVAPGAKTVPAKKGATGEKR